MPKRVEHPIILGIVGDSASGKTTLTAGVAQILGEDRCTVLCTDDYHRWDRRERMAKGVSAINPQANYVDILEQHLQHLREGDAILKPVYDHRDGSFGRPKYVKPKEFVIAEGLSGYTTRAMRDCYDVKIYLDPDEDLRIKWKIHRDTTKRGYTPRRGLGVSSSGAARTLRNTCIRSAPSPISSSMSQSPKSGDGSDTQLDVRPHLAPDLAASRLLRRCSTARAMPGSEHRAVPATATASRSTCSRSTATSPTSVPSGSRICCGT